jgi:hypothetical protein
MPDLVERLKHLPSHTIVLYTSFSQDAAGAKFTDGGASAIVAAAANAPVFGLSDASFNHGEVGGKLSSMQEQGRMACAIKRQNPPTRCHLYNSQSDGWRFWMRLPKGRLLSFMPQRFRARQSKM